MQGKPKSLEKFFQSLIETGQIKENMPSNLEGIVDESSTAASKHVSIQEIGSFFVGGRQTEIAGLVAKAVRYAENTPALTVDPNGTYSTGQVYVQYARLTAPRHPFPIIFLNSGTSTGAMWETTPDGRTGWQMHFLRHGYNTYMTDAVGKGRASWSRFPDIFKVEPTFRPHEETWKTLRIGTHYNPQDPGAGAFQNTQFPVESYEQYGKQVVPRFAGQDEIELQAYRALVAETGPCIVVGQSSGVYFALRLALAHPEQIKAVVGIEPTAFPDVSDSKNVETLQKLPQLFLWGDHLQEFPMWQNIREHAHAYTCTLEQKQSRLTVVDLPSLGIAGNTHQLMMDRNSGDIAGIATRWLCGL